MELDLFPNIIKCLLYIIKLYVSLLFLTASKVRGKVASIPFEQFHKHSANIITAAVFGKNADGEVNNEVIFTANNLVSQW